MSEIFNNIYSFFLRYKKVLVWAFFSCALFLNFYHFSIHWNDTLSDLHGFRQSQTAITVYYFIKDGIRLDYITPVLCPPWSFPIEFPVYQVIVALIVKCFHFPIDQTGRAVSVFFYLASLSIIYLILMQLNFTLLQRIFLLSLIILNPTFNFWPRTFMIETTALFFSLLFCFAVVGYDQTNKSLFVWLALISGGLGAAIKITTFALFILLALIFLYWKIQSYEYRAKLYSKPVWIIILIFPILITIVWNVYTDSIKNADLMGWKMSSYQHLKVWILWNIHDRFSIQVWKTLADNSMMIIKIMIPLLFLYKLKYWKAGFMIFILFWIGPLIFTRLYYHHAYYFVANGIFLSISLGLLILSLLQSKYNYVAIFSGLVLIPATFYYSNYKYSYYYEPAQRSNNSVLLKIAESVKENTKSNEVIMIYGNDWNPEIPYYSERKAIAMNGWIEDNDENFDRIVYSLKEEKIGAILMIGDTIANQSPSFRNLKRLGFSEKPVYSNIQYPSWNIYSKQ